MNTTTEKKNLIESDAQNYFNPKSVDMVEVQLEIILYGLCLRYAVNGRTSGVLPFDLNLI